MERRSWQSKEIPSQSLVQSPWYIQNHLQDLEGKRPERLKTVKKRKRERNYVISFQHWNIAVFFKAFSHSHQNESHLHLEIKSAHSDSYPTLPFFFLISMNWSLNAGRTDIRDSPKFQACSVCQEEVVRGNHLWRNLNKFTDFMYFIGQ